MRGDPSLNLILLDRATMEERRIHALDFVLNILREHEKRLDELIERLDYTIQSLSVTQQRLETLYERIEEKVLG